MLLHGSDRVVRATQDRLYEVRQLQDYHAIEDPGFTLGAIIPASGTETKDGEANVRVKAKELVDLIQVINSCIPITVSNPSGILYNNNDIRYGMLKSCNILI